MSECLGRWNWLLQYLLYSKPHNRHWAPGPCACALAVPGRPELKWHLRFQCRCRSAPARVLPAAVRSCAHGVLAPPGAPQQHPRTSLIRTGPCRSHAIGPGFPGVGLRTHHLDFRGRALAGRLPSLFSVSFCVLTFVLYCLY